MRVGRSALVLLGTLFAIAATLQIRGTVTLLDSLANGRNIPDFPFDVDPATMEIRAPSQAAADAGLQRGDVLRGVDGAAVVTRIGYVHALLSRAAGDTVVIRAERKGRGQMMLHIRLAPLRPEGTTWRDVLEILFIAILTPWFCLLLGGFVTWRRPRDPAAIALFFFLWGLSKTFSTNAQYALGWGPWFTIPGFVLLGVGTSLWPSAFLWFSVVFPEPGSRYRILPWTRWVFGVPALLAGLAGGVAAAGIHHLGAAYPVWARTDRWIPGWLILLLFAGPLVVGLSNLIYKVIREPGVAARRRLRILLTGLSAGMLPLFALISAGALLDRDPNSFGQVILTTVAVLFFFVPATMAYVVVVQRAMDLGIVIRQGLQYAFASNSVTVMRLGLSTLLIWLAVSLSSERGQSAWLRWGGIALCGAAIVLIRRGADWLRTKVDRRFFREAVDTERVLAELGEQVHRIIDAQSLLGTVCESVARSLHATRVAALVLTDGALRPAAGWGFDAGLPEVALAAAGEAGQRLSVSSHVVRAPGSDEFGQDDRRALSELGAELLLPMSSKGRLLGALSLGPKQSEAPFSASDLRLLQSVAAQAGLALENTRLAAAYAEETALREGLKRELEIARDVQQRMFPKAPPAVPGLDLAGDCRPAQTVGGDYYDFLPAPSGEIGLGVGDVSGKGVPAALLMAGLRASLRGLMAAGLTDLGDLMTRLNRLVYEATPSSRFATFWYGLYEPASGRLRYSSAGHNPALLIRASGEVDRLSTGGIGLGLSARSSYLERQTVLRSGDRLVLYTDGVTEAMNVHSEEFGEQRLEAVAKGFAGDAAGLVRHVMAAVDAFCGAVPQHDDITLIVSVRR